jgi:hypothetical protein
MATIEFAERGATTRTDPATYALTRAALATRGSPLLLASQPCRWRIAGGTAELRADRNHRSGPVDRDARLLMLSCGAALHQVRTALAGTGVFAEVACLPEPADAGLLARIRVTGYGQPVPAAVRAQQAMALRCTDGSPVANVEVPAGALAELRAAAEGEGARLALLGHDHRAILEAAAEPIDQFTRYAVLFADADTPLSWLCAGEALSAVVLAATMRRLAISPMIDGVDRPAARRRLRELLGGSGYPMLVLRVAVPADRARIPASPRARPSRPSPLPPR